MKKYFKPLLTAILLLTLLVQTQYMATQQQYNQKQSNTLTSSKLQQEVKRKIILQMIKVDNELTKEAEKLFKEMEGKMEN